MDEMRDLQMVEAVGTEVFEAEAEVKTAEVETAEAETAEVGAGKTEVLEPEMTEAETTDAEETAVETGEPDETSGSEAEEADQQPQESKQPLNQHFSQEAKEICFEDEKNYVAAREIINSLVRRELLTEDEVKEIDNFLRQQFKPIFSTLIADYPAFPEEDGSYSEETVQVG